MRDPVKAVSVQDVSEETTASVPGASSRLQSATLDEQPPELVEADLLIEDVSIDGMCGVY
jgi:mycofactocin precursor